MEFKEVFKGIDSLYVSYEGNLRNGIKEQLEEKKKQAQSEDEKEQSLARMTLEDHRFEVMDKGVKWYSFILMDNWYRIQVSGSKGKVLPKIYVQISSELLTGYGPDNSINKLREIVNRLLEGIEEETISRADIFVDFNTDEELEKIENTSWVTRAKKLSKYWNGGLFTGLSIGLGGIISARIYDKTIEIEESRKDYLKEIWEKQGWDTFQRVWRLEFQLRRECLGQMSINTFSSLMEKVNALWVYCASDWLRLAVKGDTVNRTRWTTNPMWEKIQGVRINDGKLTGILRQVNKSRIPSDKALYEIGMGFITSFAAKEGFENVDKETLNKYLEGATNYHKKKTNGNEEDYLNTKISLKKTKYNKT
ncbi:MAG: hypothetical protein HUU08_14230 [Candidatus Brocadia sp.]|nr:hypothetical protein [Candidatus Brocadia sp.]